MGENVQKTRTTLQKLILANQEETRALYWRGSAALRGGALVIPPDGSVSFDTYFNAFSTLKWRKYTSAGRVQVSIEIAGRGQVALCGVSRTDLSGEVEIVRIAYDYPEAVSVVLCEKDIHDLYDYCFVKVFAEKETRLSSVEYLSNAVSRDIRIACCVCTYKREAELQRNVDALRAGIIENPSSVLFEKLDIYIADNGHTLFENSYAARLADGQGRRRIHIFENKNCGGSGGFTRCLIEALLRDAEPRYTHVILMDDDAVVKPFVVERTAMFLGVLREEYRDAFLGGAMLFQESPMTQSDSGAFFDDEGHIQLHNAGLKLNHRDNVFKNEGEEERINYCGWFYCCMPENYINNKNLPLPLFLHGDDIEYGVRSKRDILTLNGICVWHPNLGAKQPPSISYYDARNYLILKAEMSQGTPRRVKKQFVRMWLLPFLLRYRYNDAYYALRGMADFYKGIDWLKEQDAERLHQEIRAWKQDETCALDIEGIHFEEPYNASNLFRVFRMLFNWLLPAFRGRAVYDIRTPLDKTDYFGRKEIFFVDNDTGKGVCRRKNYREFWKVIRECTRLWRVIDKNHDRVWKEWHDRIHELQSLDFWEAYLGLEK